MIDAELIELNTINSDGKNIVFYLPKKDLNLITALDAKKNSDLFYINETKKSIYKIFEIIEKTSKNTDYLSIKITEETEEDLLKEAINNINLFKSLGYEISVSTNKITRFSYMIIGWWQPTEGKEQND